MTSRRVMAIAAASLLAASPLAAQQVEEPVVDEAAPATETVQEEMEDTQGAEEPTVNASFFPTYVLFAPDRFLTTYGGESELDADLEICLEEGESLRLSRPGARIDSMELRGPLCTFVSQAPAVATILVEEERQTPSVRTGAVRGTGVLSGIMGNPRLPRGFRVASGSADVLERFPRGTPVRAGMEVCLERGQQVTLISSRGQRVTYRGPGCARRNMRPTRDNIGGFTFGWNTFGPLVEVVALP